MSEQGSDSEAKEWTVVTKEGDVDGNEGSDDASSHSSLEFVQLDEDAARFSLRTRSTSKSSDPGGDPADAEPQDNLTGSVSSSPELVSPSDDEGEESAVADDPVPPEATPEINNMTDSRNSDSDASSLEVINPEADLDNQSAETTPSPEVAIAMAEMASSQPEVLPNNNEIVTQENAIGVEGDLQKGLGNDLGNMAGHSKPDEIYFDEDEVEYSDEDEEDDLLKQESEPQPCCSRDGPTIDLNCRSDDPPVIAQMKAYLKQFSDSDSDSDFVRLDAAGTLEEGAVGGAPAARVAPSMSASSSSSMATSTSSVSSNFRFIHPFGVPAVPHPFQIQPQQDPENEDDNAAVPGDVDDRCESDISGVADTSDLSSVLYQLGDDPLTADDVPRHYCHHPNERLDAVLTTIALLALFLAVGIGIGHFIGTTRESSLRKQFINRMKELQDDYLMCLRDQSILQNNIKKQPRIEEKFGLLMGAWQEKYQELLMEKANLEVKVADLERHLVDSEVHQNRINTINQQVSNLMKFEEVKELKTGTAERSEAITTDDDNNDVDMMELEGHIAAVETIEQELKQRLEDSELRLQEYVKLQAQATETIHALQTRLYQVDEEKQDLSQDVGELHTQHTQLLIHNKQLETEKNQLMDQIINLKDVKSELQLINIQLENQNVAVVSQLQEEKQQIEKLESRLTQIEEQKNKMEKLINPPKVAEAELELHDAIQRLKDELNQVELEKSELLTTLAKLRYMQHPGNPESKHEPDQRQQKNLKNQMNQLIAENDELKTTVGKMRYSPPLVTEEDINGDGDQYEKLTQEKINRMLVETRRQLAKEKDVSHLWQTLYVAEKVSNEKRESGVTSSFMTCLSLLLPQVTPGNMGSMLLSNATQIIQLQWEFLQNVTTDSDFMNKLHDRWVDLQHYAGRASEELKHMPDEALAVYGILQQALTARWESFVKANFTIPWLKDVFLNATQSEPFQKSVEETRHTVRQLKDTVHDTWEKVRDMSSAFLKQHETKFDDVKEKVRKKISDMGLKVQNKMEEVRQTLTKSGFFGKFEKETKSRQKRDVNDETIPRLEEESNRLHYERTNDGQTNGKFEDKPSHKQTQSDHEVYKQYQEYWRNTGFEPDDILEEGFFQGNNREWRKHQKTLRKLHGRINRLNEDVITSMDDDEIEDLYDDLEDLQDDLDKSEQPEKLKTWLTCQIRWWKSRFQRKKRDEDLIRGCGKQMMHWQLRVICKELCGLNMGKSKGKSCKTCSAILSLNPQGFHNTPPKTVAKSQPSLQNHDKGSETAFTKGNTGRRMDKHSANSHNSPQTWMDYAVPQAVNLTMGPKGDWYLKRMQARDDHKGNSQWYVSRMENREDRRHDPLWYIRSIDEHSADKSNGFRGDFANDNGQYKREKQTRQNVKNKNQFSGFDWEQNIREESDSSGRRTVHHHYRYHKHHQPRHGRHHRHHRSFS